MSSNFESYSLNPQPISVMVLRDIADPFNLALSANKNGKKREEAAEIDEPPKIAFTEREFADRIIRERSEACKEAEVRMRAEMQSNVDQEQARVCKTLGAFATERDTYFCKVEAEVVQLALAIAAKILHREAQVDPTLLTALVRLALERMRDGSGVTIRVAGGHGPQYERHFKNHHETGSVHVVEDVLLNEYDCVLETEIGSTNIGLNAQLKEVEQGFFDLLALKPAAQ